MLGRAGGCWKAQPRCRLFWQVSQGLSTVERCEKASSNRSSREKVARAKSLLQGGRETKGRRVVAVVTQAIKRLRLSF